MNALQATNSATTTDTAAIRAALGQACGYIAPNWPLDQMIAVNPLWELRHLDIHEVMARIATLGNIRTHLGPEFYRETAGPAAPGPQPQAAAQSPAAAGEEAQGDAAADHWMNISDMLDQDRNEHQMPWREEIVHQISQFCADCFGDAGPLAKGPCEHSLYALWLKSIRQNLGLSVVMGAPGIRQEFIELPDSAEDLFSEAADAFELTPESAEHYAHALLLHINGWASWVAYQRWQANLRGEKQDLMPELLAIRLAWELALWRYSQRHHHPDFRRLKFTWQRQTAALPLLLRQQGASQAEAWKCQRAAELAYQRELTQRLGQTSATATKRPALQAVFCIDVRSEVIRRHLEAQSPDIQTRGFAGFFGMPIEYRSADGSFARPHLPGLLAPSLTLTAQPETGACRGNARRVGWLRTGDAPAAMFSLVETSGPFYLWKLLRDSFAPKAANDPVRKLADTTRLELRRDQNPVCDEERIELAATILHTMGLETGFAPHVLLVGHGAESPNNPHAAALNCGACGGQSGEFNALALASLLNDPAVREGLKQRGVEIPADTRFIAALHETVSDDLRIIDGASLPTDVATWLDSASSATRRERSQKLGLSTDCDKKLAKRLRRRARDWSEVRHEWGLAGNASFIVAPRSLTRGTDLAGRAFLHDYDWRQDADLSVLETIMTAPMIVTHWINMQYNASVTDNDHYGSGNKVLHNVVAGNIGVFEGNGGDLRIGLPLQSVHNGERWMHTPLRLSVFIAAPEDGIAAIYRKHEVVRHLVDNEWLYLFRIADNGEASRLHRDTWQPQGLVE